MVRLLTQAPAQDWTAHLREREEAAYENGRQEGERALSEQLLQQRNEIVQLQNGVMNSLQQILPAGGSGNRVRADPTRAGIRAKSRRRLTNRRQDG